MHECTLLTTDPRDGKTRRKRATLVTCIPLIGVYTY